MRRMLGTTRMGTHEHERVGKDMTLESKAIQAQIEETRHAQKQRSPEDYRCPYCWGTLWVEYIENGRYLVKCDREKDRIQYVRAGDPHKAIEKCAMMIRPRDEWHEDHYDVLWFADGAPREAPRYVGSPLDEDWDEDYDQEYTHWMPIPAFTDYKEDAE